MFKKRRLLSLLLCITLIFSNINLSSIGVYATDDGFVEDNGFIGDDGEDGLIEDNGEAPDDKGGGSGSSGSGEHIAVGVQSLSNGEDTTWQNNFEYTLDESTHRINVTRYIGDSTVTDVSVLGVARINGIEYETHIQGFIGNGYYDSLGAQYIQTIYFGDGVVFDNMGRLFEGCKNVTSITFGDIDTSNVTTMFGLFSNCNKLESIDLSEFDTGNVTDMSYMFHSCYKLTALDVSRLNTSNVKEMRYMFGACQSLKSLDISSFDTSKVTSLNGMFSGCESLTSINADIDTSNVKNMGSMFTSCHSLTTIDVEDWDVSNVTEMSFMFEYADKLSNIDISKWNVSNVIFMQDMFNGCDSLTTIDVSKWDVSSVINMESMFYSCDSLIYIDVSDWDVSSVTNMHNTFVYCSSLNNLDVSNWNVSNVKDLRYTFDGCESLNELDVSNWNTSNVTMMERTFEGCISLTTLDVEDWDVSNVTTMEGTFCNCISLKELNLNKWNTSNVKTMSAMFNLCENLETLNINNFNISKVQDMEYLFNGCKSLQYLDLNNWETNECKIMQQMFSGCSKLKTLDISNLDTSNVTNMQYMFQRSPLLEEIDLSSFDTSRVTNMNSMFKSCTGLSKLDLRTFNTANVTDMGDLFNSCSSLKEIYFGSNFSFDASPSASGMFLDCSNLGKVHLPASFAFRGSSSSMYSSNILPNGSWAQLLNDGTINNNKYTETELFNNWNSSMEGTYVKVFDVLFNPAGGKADFVKKSGYIGGVIGNLPNATKKGYYFLGWYTKTKNGDLINSSSLVTQNKYYAHWNPIKYTLTFDANGGTGSIDSVDLKYDTPYTLKSGNITREGYELVGWNTRSNGKGQSYSLEDSISRLTDTEGDVVTLYAEWDIVGYQITFDSQGGSSVLDIYIKPNNEIEYLYSPTKEGYTFDGWYATSDYSGDRIDNGYRPNGDTTFYAKWVKNIEITFDSNGGDSETISKTYKNGSNIGKMPVFKKGNYTFLGFYTEANGGEQIKEDKTLRVSNDGDTYYAHYGMRLHFNPSGGEITTPSDSYNVNIENPESYIVNSFPEAQKDGYTLLGWYTAETGGTKINLGDTINVTSNNTLYAHWQDKEIVTLTYDINGGKFKNNTNEHIENNPTTKYYKGDKLAALYDCDTYYDSSIGKYRNFLGWYTAPTGGTKVNINTQINNDMTVYAHWSEDTYTVYFNKNGGSNVHGIGYESTRFNNVGAQYKIDITDATDYKIVSLPGAYYANHILEGWYPNPDGTGEKLTTDTVITESKMYYAKWINNRTERIVDGTSFVYDASWTNSSNDQVDNINNRLYYHPTNYYSQSATLHVLFELNESVDKTLPVGSVKIQVPKYAFKDWDGNWYGTNNLSNNIPAYPNVRNGMFFSYIEEDDHYILVNNTPLSGGAGIDVVISYNIPYYGIYNIPGGAQNQNGVYLDGYEYYNNTFPIIYSIDTDEDGNPDITAQKEVGIEVHTKAASSRYKEAEDVLYKWDSEWQNWENDSNDYEKIEKPVDADDYFYIRWNLNASSSGGVSQRMTYKWSEDTVHDGTVIYMDDDYVITKHPRSLLATEEAGKSGITLTNTAYVTETWKSGYSETHRVVASTTVYNATYPTGWFDKYDSNYSSSNWWKINGGQEDILDDKKEVELQYKLIYDGGADTAPTWDVEQNTYVANKRTIEINDGNRGDVMYSSGNASEPFVWVPDTDNIILNDNDYYWERLFVNITEYDAVSTGGIWSDRIKNTDKNTYDSYEVWIRSKWEDDYHLYKTFSPDTTYISLPPDTVGFKVRHATDFYFTKIDIYAYMKLKPTSNIQNLIQEDVDMGVTSIIKNIGRCSVIDKNGNEFFSVTNRIGDNDSALKEAYELNISNTDLQVTISNSSTENIITDSVKGTQDAYITMTANNYNNAYRTKRIQSGTFYNLLPLGTNVEESSITGTYSGGQSGTLNKSNYNVTFIDNWENSGRTMMKVDVGLPDSIKASQINFNYYLRNTFENIIQRGTNIESDVAFVNTTPEKVIYHDITNKIDAITQKEYFKSLENTYDGSIGFAKTAVAYNPVDAFSWGFSKAVRTKTNYETESETLPNNEYAYQLTYSQSDLAKSDKIVFYDILEGGTDTKQSEWYGTLKNVNVESIKDVPASSGSAITCNPVVYYSTKNRNSFTSSDFDVSKTSVWTTEKPADASSITAIAVDCSKGSDENDFVLEGKSVLSVGITMQAPSDASYIGKSTTNEGISYARKMSHGVLEGDATAEYSDATVTIKDFDINIEKSSNPVSGTSILPKRVEYENDLSYTIAVTNNDTDFTVHDVLVEDNIPAGLDVNWDNISVYVDNEEDAVSIGNSPRATMNRNYQKVMFRVHELLPGETLHIKIPTMVNVYTSRFENTSKITSINGITKDISSNTTYHEVKPTSVTISKYAYGTTTRLAGARLQLRATSGRIIDTWDTSSNEDKTISVAAGTYTLTELSAPEHYVIANPITFEVTTNGDIVIDGETVSKVNMYDRGDKHNYHFEKEWQIFESEKPIILGLAGSNDLTETEEKALKANNTFTITAKKGLLTTTFEATADKNGLITVPDDYKSYTEFSFTAYTDDKKCDFSYNVSYTEPTQTDSITIHASEQGKEDGGQLTDTITLNEADNYEADYIFSSADVTFNEDYPTGWSSPPSGNAVQITFDENFRTESRSYDYVIIYFEHEGEIYQFGKYGGSTSGSYSLAGQTITVPSKNVWLYWRTDGSEDNYYGFKVTSISSTELDTFDIENYDTATLPRDTLDNYNYIDSGSLPESAHSPYGDDVNTVWHINGDDYNSNAANGPYTVTEDGADFTIHFINYGEKKYVANPSLTTTLDFKDYHFEKEWQTRLDNEPLVLGLSGSNSFTEAEERAMKAGNEFEITATKDETSQTFTATADSNGLITVPDIYKYYDEFTFSITHDDTEYSFTYTASNQEPEKPDTITLLPSKSGLDSNGEIAASVVLSKDDDYEADYQFASKSMSFQEVYPDNWTPPAVSGNAVQITFDENFETESRNYDYVRLYFEYDGQIYQYRDSYESDGETNWFNSFGGSASGRYSLSGKTITLPSQKVWVYWHSDSSDDGYYGFKTNDVSLIQLDNINIDDAHYQVSELPDSDLTNYQYIDDADALPESAHSPYGNRINTVWAIDKSSGPRGKVVVTPSGDGYNVHITNYGTAQRVATVTVERISTDTPVQVRKEWNSASKIFFNIVNSNRTESGKVSSIAIKNTTGDRTYETISVNGNGTGAVVSNQTYDIQQSYVAHITFTDSTTTQVTINPTPYSPPAVTVRFNDTSGTKDVVLNAQGGWTNTVNLTDTTTAPEEVTTGDWTYTYHIDNVTGDIVLENTINREIPVVNVYSPDVPWIIQTGTHGLPNWITPLFLAACVLTGVSFWRRKKRKA